MSTPNYTDANFDNWTVTFGALIIDGWAEGVEPFTVKRDEPSFTKKVGRGGKVARSKTLNRSGSVTLNLMSVSAANDVLSALLLADENVGNGTSVLPLKITDHNGRSVYFAAQAWIVGFPEAATDLEATTRTWMIDCATLELNIGGN